MKRDTSGTAAGGIGLGLLLLAAVLGGFGFALNLGLGWTIAYVALLGVAFLALGFFMDQAEEKQP